MGIGRRAGVAGVVGVLALGAGMASASATEGPEQVAACTFQTVTVPSKQFGYVPPHDGGDRDFAGHGPAISVLTYLVSPVGSTRNLPVRVIMDARETQSDYTHAHGTFNRVIYTAPSGWLLDSIVSPVLGNQDDSAEYVDTDHADDVFSATNPNSFVKTYVFVGDTAGNEAGTRTSVVLTTQPVTVRLSRCT